MKLIVEEGKVIAQAENVEEVRALLAMPTNPSYRCGVCGRGFDGAKGLNVHTTKMHETQSRFSRHMPRSKLVPALG